MKTYDLLGNKNLNRAYLKREKYADEQRFDYNLDNDKYFNKYEEDEPEYYYDDKFGNVRSDDDEDVYDDDAEDYSDYFYSRNIRKEVLEELPEWLRDYDEGWNYLDRRKFTALQAIVILEPLVKKIKTRYREYGDWYDAYRIRHYYVFSLLEQYGGNWKLGSKKNIKCFKDRRRTGMIPFYIPPAVKPCYANTPENQFMAEMSQRGIHYRCKQGHFNIFKFTREDYVRMFNNAESYNLSGEYSDWILIKERCYRYMHPELYDAPADPDEGYSKEELCESLVNEGCKWDPSLNETIKELFPEYVMTEAKKRAKRIAEICKRIRESPECEEFERMLRGHDEDDSYDDDEYGLEMLDLKVEKQIKREREYENLPIEDRIEQLNEAQERLIEEEEEYARAEELKKEVEESVTFTNEYGKEMKISDLAKDDLVRECDESNSLWVDLQIQTQAAAKLHKKMMKIREKVMKGERPDIKDESDLIIYERHQEIKIKKKLKKQFLAGKKVLPGQAVSIFDKIAQAEMDEILERDGVYTKDYLLRHPDDYVLYYEPETNKMIKIPCAVSNKKILYRGVWLDRDELQITNKLMMFDKLGIDIADPREVEQTRQEKEKLKLQKKEAKRLAKQAKQQEKAAKRLHSQNMYNAGDDDDNDDDVGMPTKKKKHGVEDPNGEVLDFILSNMADEEAKAFKNVLGELIDTGDISPKSQDKMLNPKTPDAIKKKRGWD